MVDDGASGIRGLIVADIPLPASSAVPDCHQSWRLALIFALS